MDIQDILIEWLVENGYEGLCYENCGCGVDALMVCGGMWLDGPHLECEPAHKASPKEIKELELEGADRYMVPGKKLAQIEKEKTDG